MKKLSVSKLASQIRSRRTKMKLTREQLAKQGKVNYNTIIKLESGANKNPTVKTLIGLSMVFKCGMEDLLK